MKILVLGAAVAAVALLATSCGNGGRTPEQSFEAVYATFDMSLPVEPPFSYKTDAPGYIQSDTRAGNPINDRKATLGRVLFYDKALSDNGTLSCASCHKQQFAFSDTAQRSTGLNGLTTERHSMRLVNNRFSKEQRMFWDERAVDLEDQVLQPIKDHIEMGFSGSNGQPDINALIEKLQSIAYYEELFAWSFDGDGTVSSAKIALALTDFVHSIESFDTKFDAGFTTPASIDQPFQNFTAQENEGKSLFLNPPSVDINSVRVGGGAGCASCHIPPAFSIDPNSLNNGVDHKAGEPAASDFTNTKSPSLRDLIGLNGTPNGPMMHTGDFLEFTTVIEHYNEVIADVNNTSLDQRLKRGPNSLKLELSTTERAALEAFIKTLTGNAVYTDDRWSSPF